jgi:integral membrane protein
VKNPAGPLRPYQVLATIVGLNLLFVFAAAFAQRATDDTSWWNRNEGLILAIDQVHGLLFMGLLVLIALLSTRNKWTPGFTISTMLLATIPFVSFWAERRASRAVHPAPRQNV